MLVDGQVCCAWDVYITMYGSDADTAEQVDIPSVYVTMADGKALLDAGEVNVQVGWMQPPARFICKPCFVLLYVLQTCYQYR